MRHISRMILPAVSTAVLCMVFAAPIFPYDAESDLPSQDDFVAIDVMPEIISETLPEYPAEAVKKGLEGEVIVKALIDKKGSPLKVIAAKSSGEKMLDEAALEAARSYTFSPGMKDGQPVAVWVSFKIAFRLSEGDEKSTAGKPDVVPVEIAPRIMSQAKPEYPEEALQMKLEGVVTLQVYIDRKGNPAEIKVARSSGWEILDNSALEAAKKYRFSPGMQDGKPIAAWVSFNVAFKL